MVRTAFPDASWTIEDIIAEEDTAAVRVTFRGTQQAEFLGIAPRGKTVAMPAMAFIRIVDGKLAETWLLRDRPTLIAQLTA
jgi:predicted ester cyclase